MRTTRSAVVVLLAAAGVLFAATDPAAAGPDRIRVYVEQGAPTHVDELAGGLGPGDWLLSRDRVMDEAGEVIGTAVTRVQVVAPADGDDLAFVLDCTLDLADGRLLFTGAEQLSRLSSTVTYVVVGGTGRYVGAEGQVTGRPGTVDGAAAAVMTFELLRQP